LCAESETVRLLPELDLNIQHPCHYFHRVPGNLYPVTGHLAAKITATLRDLPRYKVRFAKSG